MTICYFTASGNCLYVARRIGGTLLSIPQLMRQETMPACITAHKMRFIYRWSRVPCDSATNT